ncbi:MAG: sulfatase-like hydrolase/transferase, partial [Planctomycetota bacterium]
TTRFAMRHLFAILLVATALASLVGEAWCNPERPNFLIIVTDDQACGTLGAYGDAVIDTPNLDRLAEEGMTFDAARHMGAWSAAVCTPSRHMIMTGRSVWRIPGTPAVDQPMPPNMAWHSLPAVFNRAGYDTFRTCKVGNSYTGANAEFQTQHAATKRGGLPATGSAWHARQVLSYLDDREATADSDPWLIYLGFSHPHDERDGPPELLAKYGAVSPGPPDEVNASAPPLPVNYLQKHPFPHGHPELRDEVAVPGVDRRHDEAAIRNELGKQAACIEAIDTQVGRVLDRLREAGELETTYVFFTSDHGIAVGSHGLMGKQNLYDHSWRVPLIVRGPGVPAGVRSDALVYLGELMPTVCDLADIKAPDTVELPSYAPVLLEERDDHHAVQYGVYSGGTKPGIRAVTDGRWKLVEWDVLDGTVRETQLFDLEANPHELLDGPDPRQHDLAEDPIYAAQRQRLEALLAEECERWGDPYPLSPSRQ